MANSTQSGSPSVRAGATYEFAALCPVACTLLLSLPMTVNHFVRRYLPYAHSADMEVGEQR